MMRFHPKHVRVRLTLWFLMALAVFLALYAAGSSALLLWDLRGQLNRYARQDLETVEGLLSFNAQGGVVFKEDYHNHPESKLVQERYLEVLSESGQVLFRNARLGSQDLGGAVFTGEGQGGYSDRDGGLSDGTRILLLSRRHTMEGRMVLIRLAYSEEPARQQYRQLLTALALAFPVVMLAAGLPGYFLVRRTLRPLERMARRAAEITPERLHERLPVENAEDELGQLAGVFNLMLERLEHSFGRMKRFTADASHELRTPLACIRTVGEVSLQKDEAPEQFREAIGSMLEESERLTALVNHLLTLSRADAGEHVVQAAHVSIEKPVREAAALLEVLIEEKALRLEVDVEKSAAVSGDPVLLRQAFVNLLHNAVKYSPVGGVVRIQGQAAHGKVSVTVSDQGEGIKEEDREKIFERFYRVDSARSRESGGAGLGLAIVKWTIETHNGKVMLDPSSAHGTVFRVELPSRPLEG
jgi:heavy metal sensor kinase